MGQNQNQILEDEDDDFYFEDFSSHKDSNLLLNKNLIVPKKINSNPFDDYKYIKDIGEGTYSKVQLVQNKINSSIYAMKVIQKRINSITNKSNEIEVYREVKFLIKIDHPNITKIFEFYDWENDYYLIMEHCEGGILFDKIIQSDLNEMECAHIMYQILSAVNYCHKMRIIHRDLKLENILIKNDEHGLSTIKIGDFGTSKSFKIGDVQKRLVGSAYYVAPEVIQKKYNSKCDIWSCGVIMYVLLTKKPPFSGETDDIILKNISIGKYNNKLLDKYTPEASNLIGLLLEKNIKKRINAEKALNHPWFKLFKSKEILTKFKDENIIKRFVENLKNYKKGNIIKEIALAYLVHNCSDLDEILNASKLFGQIDHNNKGKISLDDLISGLKQIEEKNIEEDAVNIFKNLDGFENGYIEYEKFIKAVIDKKLLLNEDNLKLVFKFFDKENKNLITKESIYKIFEDSIKKDENIKKQLETAIKDINTNKEELTMDFKNFSEYINNIF